MSRSDKPASPVDSLTPQNRPQNRTGLQGDGHDERGDYGRGPPPGAHQGENERKDP